MRCWGEEDEDDREFDSDCKKDSLFRVKFHY